MVDRLFSTLTSLRARFIVGMGLMLLPLAILVISAFLGLQRTVHSVERVVEDPVEELLFAQRLQNQILRTGFPLYHYANHGDPRHREEYARLLVEIDIGFDKALSFKYLSDTERELLLGAKQEWRRAIAIAEEAQHVRLRPDRDEAALAQQLDDFGLSLSRAVRQLDAFSEAATEEIHAQRDAAYSTKNRSSLFIIVIFAAGFVVAVTAAVSLARSVLAPISILRHSAARIGQGDFTSRAPLKNNDELGNLAAAFNTMAAKLEKVQKELEYLSTHDALTGLIDRKKFHEALENERHRAQRYNRTFALLMVDVDSFKDVNLTYGRLVGDSVLCSVAARIVGTIRPTDLAARYKGEEMALVLSETDYDGALETAERVRKTLAETPLNIGDGRELSVTLSIGVAVFPHDANNDEELLELVRRALRVAKVQGRNQVCAARDLVKKIA